MPSARIFRPAKNSMQSGQGRTRRWLLEFDATAAKSVEPLMGYTSSGDMRQQLRLSFDSLEAAIDYAKREGIDYRVVEPNEPKRRMAAYSDNFRSNRVGMWTH